MTAFEHAVFPPSLETTVTRVLMVDDDPAINPG
jgi:hypothetical protein